MQYENTFVREVKEKNITKPDDILNWYRNLYHTEDNHTEHGIMAYAINDYFQDSVPRSEYDAVIEGQLTLQRHIGEKNAEIERLQKLHDDKCDRCIARDRAEAIKEFAERLKASKVKPEFPCDDFFVTESTIDDLVKEMTEEKKCTS